MCVCLYVSVPVCVYVWTMCPCPCEHMCSCVICGVHVHSGFSPLGGEPPPHAVTVQHPFFAHNAASKAQDLAVLRGVGKGTAAGEAKGRSPVKWDLRTEEEKREIRGPERRNGRGRMVMKRRKETDSDRGTSGEAGRGVRWLCDAGARVEGCWRGVGSWGSHKSLHEVGAVRRPVWPVLGPQFKGLVTQLRAEGVLEATQHYHHPLKDLSQLLWARSGCFGLGVFSSRLPWHSSPSWGRDGGGGWVSGGSEH